MSWVAILRLGVVNAALGAVVALVTFTLNRVMTVELALPATVPGALVALHYAVQMLRPRLGHGSDLGVGRTPWILGGLVVLCTGGLLAAVAVALMPGHRLAGLALAVAAYGMVGAGVGAVGTSSLALMATRVAPSRRAAAATLFWLLMIVGAVLTAGASAHFLHPFSFDRLVRVASVVACLAFLTGAAAIHGIETSLGGTTAAIYPIAACRMTFRAALHAIHQEPASRRFAIFVFVAMLAYSAQELILEPFAGAVFALSPARTAALTGLHQGGVLVGMGLVAVVGSLAGAGRPAVMRWLAAGGCVGSAAGLAGLAGLAIVGQAWPLPATLFALGAANGAFAVAAIGAMLGLAAGTPGAGIRMGVWGAAQAIAMGLGGLISTGASDLARAISGTPDTAYAAVFLGQAALFLVAARLAGRVFQDTTATPQPRADLRAAAAA